MSLKITDECINCGACEAECPNSAIYEGSVDWRWKDGTKLSGIVVLPTGVEINSEEFQESVSDDVYYIVASKCTECKGHFEESQCQVVCPVDCCVIDSEHIEDDQTLLDRKIFLHNG